MSELAQLHAEWVAAGRPLPLEVSRSRYDDTTVSWEVLYPETPWDGNGGRSTPIAEFPTWQEANEWAVTEARKSTRSDDNRRTLGPKTEYQQARADAWEAHKAGTGPHPYTTDHERLALR